MKVTLLLSDWAEVLNGKLYIMGGGWSRVIAGFPLTIGVAIMIRVPWTGANQQHRLKFVVTTADGQPLMGPTPEGEKPVMAEGAFEVGRPPGLSPGSDIDAPMAFKLGPLVLSPGRYDCELEIDGSIEATETFEALAAPPGMGGMPQ